MAAPRGEEILLLGLEGIHESCQIFIFSPLPTLHTHPLLKVARPAIILCHVKEEPALGPAFNKSP
jgi:hypothetical protein